MRISMGLLAWTAFRLSKQPTGSVHWATNYDLPGKGCDSRAAQFCYIEILQWTWGGYSWVLFPPWHFISWVWVAPHKKKDLHPSSIYHPQTLTDLARGAVIQYTEGGLKIVTLWLSCLHCVSKHWQPQSSHLQHLKTTSAVGIVCPHTKVMKATRPEKRQSGQKSWLYR